MCVIHTSESAVAIWYTEGAPPRRRLLALVRGALRAAGREPWRETEAEVFEGAGGTLLLARPKKRRIRGDILP